MLVWMILFMSFVMAHSSNAIADMNKKIPRDDNNNSNVMELSPTITIAPSITTIHDSSNDILHLRTTCESGQKPKSTSKFGRVFCSQSSQLVLPLLYYVIIPSSILLILWII